VPLREFYSCTSGTDTDGVFGRSRIWLGILHRPDFTDLEAEREFYHFGISYDTSTKKRELVEKGSVYDEIEPAQRSGPPMSSRIGTY